MRIVNNLPYSLLFRCVLPSFLSPIYMNIMFYKDGFSYEYGKIPLMLILMYGFLPNFLLFFAVMVCNLWTMSFKDMDNWKYLLCFIIPVVVTVIIANPLRLMVFDQLSFK